MASALRTLAPDMLPVLASELACRPQGDTGGGTAHMGATASCLCGSLIWCRRLQVSTQ